MVVVKIEDELCKEAQSVDGDGGFRLACGDDKERVGTLKQNGAPPARSTGL